MPKKSLTPADRVVPIQNAIKRRDDAERKVVEVVARHVSVGDELEYEHGDTVRRVRVISVPTRGGYAQVRVVGITGATYWLRAEQIRWLYPMEWSDD